MILLDIMKTAFSCLKRVIQPSFLLRFGRKATIFIFDFLAGAVLIAAVALKEVYGKFVVRAIESCLKMLVNWE